MITVMYSYSGPDRTHWDRSYHVEMPGLESVPTEERFGRVCAKAWNCAVARWDFRESWPDATLVDDGFGNIDAVLANYYNNRVWVRVEGLPPTQGPW